MKFQPSNGTNYACALSKVAAIITADEERQIKDEFLANSTQYLIVLLSDGRPGDINGNPPTIGSEKGTYKQHGVTRTSATALVSSMAENLQGRLQFFTVQHCFSINFLPTFQSLQYNGILLQFIFYFQLP